jgi:hypothetical protein
MAHRDSHASNNGDGATAHTGFDSRRSQSQTTVEPSVTGRIYKGLGEFLWAAHFSSPSHAPVEPAFRCRAIPNLFRSTAAAGPILRDTELRMPGSAIADTMSLSPEPRALAADRLLCLQSEVKKLFLTTTGGGLYFFPSRDDIVLPENATIYLVFFVSAMNLLMPLSL